MKNIHVLPTDKPSSGYVLGKCIKELSDVKIGEYTKTYHLMFSEEYFQAQNIYITSDEEINQQTEPCWCINTIKNTWNKDLIYYQGAMPQYHFVGFKKIILTTDQDLIKDGVQSIDDEFLEWFVKNPSCDEVEMTYENDTDLFGCDFNYYKITIPKEESNLDKHLASLSEYAGPRRSDFVSKEEALEHYAYKNPVYSREEILELLRKSFPNKSMSGMFNISASKQIWTFEQGLRKLGKSNAEKLLKINNMEQKTLEEEKCVAGCKHFSGGEIKHHKDCSYYNDSFSKMYDDLKSQQERSYSEEEVEEIINNAWLDYEYREGNLYKTIFKDAFELGLKLAQERMYSEEESLTLLNEYNEYLFSFIDRDEVGIGTEKEDVKKWFELNKKK